MVYCTILDVSLDTYISFFIFFLSFSSSLLQRNLIIIFLFLWHMALLELCGLGWRVDEELSVDLLRYIGEMLFELFSMLCSVIIIIKILFITHTCTTAYNIHIYVFCVQHYVEYANYICIKGFVLPYFALNIHIYVYLMHLYMGV